MFCLLVIGLFWATLLTYLNQVETTAADQAQRDVSNLTLAVEEQVKRTILGLDQVMVFAGLEFQQLPNDADLERWAAHIPHLTNISVRLAVADTQGNIVAPTTPGRPNGKPLNIADREHFRIQIERADAGLVIGRPILGHVTGRWVVPLSRRITDREGKLIGVTVLSLDPGYIQRTFAMLDVGPGGAVTLFRDDGYILARSPALPGMYGITHAKSRHMPGCIIGSSIPELSRVGCAVLWTGPSASPASERSVGYRYRWDQPICRRGPRPCSGDQAAHSVAGSTRKSILYCACGGPHRGAEPAAASDRATQTSQGSSRSGPRGQSQLPGHHEP